MFKYSHFDYQVRLKLFNFLKYWNHIEQFPHEQKYATYAEMWTWDWHIRHWLPIFTILFEWWICRIDMREDRSLFTQKPKKGSKIRIFWKNRKNKFRLNPNNPNLFKFWLSTPHIKIYIIYIYSVNIISGWNWIMEWQPSFTF